MSNSIIPGSLAAIAEANDSSIAEAFVSADTIIVVDISSSMTLPDSRGGRPRFDVAVEELTKLQATLAGKIAVVTFSSDVEFCPSGRPSYASGSTALAEALEFVHIADDCAMRFIVISDGEPDDDGKALKVAKRFKSTIDCIYVGPEGGSGSDFLRRLAQASGGKYAVNTAAIGLGDGIQRLLTAAS